MAHNRIVFVACFFFLKRQRPPRSTRPYTLFTYAMLVRSRLKESRGGSHDCHSLRLRGSFVRRQLAIFQLLPNGGQDPERGCCGIRALFPDAGLAYRCDSVRHFLLAAPLLSIGTSEGRRVGNEVVSPCSVRWSQYI